MFIRVNKRGTERSSILQQRNYNRFVSMAKLIGKLIAEVNTLNAAASDTRAPKAARETNTCYIKNKGRCS